MAGGRHISVEYFVALPQLLMIDIDLEQFS